MAIDMIVESSGDRTEVYTRELRDDMHDVVMDRISRHDPVVFLGFYRIEEFEGTSELEPYRVQIKVADAERRFEEGIPIYTMQLYNEDSSRIVEYHQYLGIEELYYDKFLTHLIDSLVPYGLTE